MSGIKWPKRTESKVKFAIVVSLYISVAAIVVFNFDSIEHTLAQLASIAAAIGSLMAAVRETNFRMAYRKFNKAANEVADEVVK